MKPEDLTPELAEQARNSTTREERLAFLRDHDIELTDEQLEMINGGVAPIMPPDTTKGCPNSPDGHQYYVRTGNIVPGQIFGDLWPNYETKCTYCGNLNYEFAW